MAPFLKGFLAFQLNSVILIPGSTHVVFVKSKTVEPVEFLEIENPKSIFFQCRGMKSFAVIFTDLLFKVKFVIPSVSISTMLMISVGHLQTTFVSPVVSATLVSQRD